MRICRNVILLMVVVACISSCAPDNASDSHFIHLPYADGWPQTMPVQIQPHYGDSNAVYDVVLAIRHTNEYPYRNLSLAVDLISDSANVTRKTVGMNLADAQGNWLGAGFGSLFQKKCVVAASVTPAQARRVSVWQTMDDTPILMGIVDLGVIVTPHKK